MWNGKSKALTFSFDDGVLQDLKLIEILDKYGLKSTFNLNSGHLGNKNHLNFGGQKINHDKIAPKDVKEVYKNHEVAVHTKTHPLLTKLSDEEIIDQVENDRQLLSALCGYEIIGMAYPCGGVNNDDRVAEIIKNNTGVQYSRTITSVYNFDLQDNLFRFNPSTSFSEKKKLFELGEKFLELKPETPQIFYIWGHSYEMDIDHPDFITWQEFEEFCKMISGQKDIFYCTNKECLL
jgi:hypothetical protein